MHQTCLSPEPGTCFGGSVCAQLAATFALPALCSRRVPADCRLVSMATADESASAGCRAAILRLPWSGSWASIDGRDFRGEGLEASGVGARDGCCKSHLSCIIGSGVGFCSACWESSSTPHVFVDIYCVPALGT